MARKRFAAGGLALAALIAASALRLDRASGAQAPPGMDRAVTDNARQMLDEGRRVFRLSLMLALAFDRKEAEEFFLEDRAAGGPTELLARIVWMGIGGATSTSRILFVSV